MREATFSYALAEIDQAAAWLIHEAGESKIWLLIGDMGAGKTTLVKAICAQLSVTGDLSSPTYSLANEYETTSGEKIFHLDLYRLRSTGEALDMGIEDYFWGGRLCLIEWPQLIMPLLREGEFITIHIHTISPVQRKITIFNQT